MKKKYLLLLLCVPAFLLSACIEDQGNYNYITLKEVGITNLSDSYRFILQGPFTLAPKITTDIDSSSLSYSWRIGADTLSKQKTLSYTFTKTLLSSDPLTFDVLDKTTNVRYSKTIQINVVSPFQTGWLVLGNNNGAPKLSFFSYEEGLNYYPDVYSEVNKEALTGTAKMVKQLNYMDGSTAVYYDRVSVICENGKSPELDGNSMIRRKFYEDEFKGKTLYLGAINSEYYSNDNALFIISEGKIYEKAPGAMGSPDDAYYQYALDGDSKGYKVADNYTKGYNYGDYYLAVDELNHRYVSFSRSSLSAKVASLTLAKGTSTSLIDPENLEGSSVWMGQGYNGNALSILKTSAGKYILHVLSGSWDGSWTLVNKYQFPDGVIDDESCFAPHKVNPYLMISTGKKLMALNLEAFSAGDAAINDICTYEASITAMHYAYNINKLVNELGIAIQTTTSSSSLLIINPSLTSKGEVLKRYDNIAGKTVSIWRKIM